MKRVVLILGVIAIGLVLAVGRAMAFPSTVGWTLVHAETYNWYSSNGTKVLSTSQTFGNTSGSVVVEVAEKVFQNPAATNQAVFSYTVFNDGFASDLTSFHISPFVEADDFTTPAGWTFDGTGGVWTWSTPGPAGIPITQSLDNMRVYTDSYSIWTLVPADVDIGGVYTGNTNWLASAPIPEPTSLLLLGSGLLGVAAMFRTRRRKV